MFANRDRDISGKAFAFIMFRANILWIDWIVLWKLIPGVDLGIGCLRTISYM